MPIPFTCPHCGVRTDVADEYAGQTGPCAACGQTITIRPAGVPPGYAPPVKHSSEVPLLQILAIVACVVVVVVVCGGILLALLLPILRIERGLPAAWLCSVAGSSWPCCSRPD